MGRDSKMPLFVNEARVRAVLQMTSMIEALRAAFRAQAEGLVTNVPRSRAKLLGKSVNITAASDSKTNRYAVKIYGGGTFHVHLYDREQGLLATIEADWLGQMRTGAANGLAASLMARPQSRSVGLIGAGRQAVTQILALDALGLVDHVSVFTHRLEKAKEFCEMMGKRVVAKFEIASSADEAVAQADIVVTATTSETPVFNHSALRPGTHINAMGANAASRMEIAPSLVHDCAFIVTDDCDQARIEGGEFLSIGPSFDWSRVRPLSEIVAAGPIKRTENDLTFYKSLGAGLEDLAAASLLYDLLVS